MGLDRRVVHLLVAALGGVGVTQEICGWCPARAELAALEAVVHSDGSRPVLFVEDDFVDVLAPAADGYAAMLSRVESAVRHVCRAAGRVDDPGSALGYQGTAWAVSEGVVVTNYHVLQAITTGASRADGVFTGVLKPGVAVDFGAEIGGGPSGRRFPIRRVLAVGRQGDPGLNHPLVRDVNFDGLDVAVLELTRVPGQKFPVPVDVAREDNPTTRGGLASRGRMVYLVGFPGDTVTTAAASHGYSRAEFYLVAAAFDRAGMTGLLDERRGRKGPVKLTEDVHTFLDSLGPCSATEAAAALADQRGVVLHPRTIQRARRR